MTIKMWIRIFNKKFHGLHILIVHVLYFKSIPLFRNIVRIILNILFGKMSPHCPFVEQMLTHPHNTQQRYG